MGFIDWYFTVVVFMFGACWGSFLNVCIYRIPAELSVVKPRSRCPKCMTDLAWKDNIPIFGWIFLGGKCRYCKVPISPRYPSIELLTAILFTWVWLVFPVMVEDGFDFRFVPYWVMVFGLILGSMVDFDEMWLPDRCTIGGMIIGPIFSFLIPAMHGAETHLGGLIDSLIGLAVGFGSLWSVSVIGKLVLKKDAMGFGDVKLMGALGAFLGWESIIFIVFVSSLIGTIVGVSFIAAGNKEWQSKIPFGPYIALAAVVWMLGGSVLWDAYLAWMQGTAY
ncbi:Leader peptidase PppA [Pontiella desulfatans]|uniref:Prepilin leader peptidase/N-methyltransferase n=1 Tax=Pontiella desulfatans TaxID=2750659 RepID=A0A6C2U4L3_PONDE|nr:A24 family peptidase [Pontiella desulfatans]VGO14992.1 Leader peptidase PppA [Pontiella desulfatans]